MSKGTDLVRPFAPLHAKVIDDLEDQLLIVFLKRLGGSINLSVKEIDDTGGDMLALSLDINDINARIFHFKIVKKQ